MSEQFEFNPNSQQLAAEEQQQLADENGLAGGEVAVLAEPGTMLALIARAATDPAVDVAKMQALLAMQRELLADQAKETFNLAFVRLQARMPRVKKNGTVDLGSKGSYSFAKWEDIDRIIRPMLDEDGFGLTFNSRMRAEAGGGLIVCGCLMHRDGHSISAEMPLPLDTGAGRNNLQAAGSTLSYGKRYVAEMLLNIVREGDDDDGVRGGSDPITLEQVDEIMGLIQASGANLSRFLEYLNVGAVADIQTRDFERAINALTAKKQRGNG